MVLYLSHVFLAGEHQLEVDDPVRLPLEECRGGVDENRGLVRHRLIPFLRPGTHECSASRLATDPNVAKIFHCLDIFSPEGSM